ncbi:YpsA SLOG family protein [Paludisphaera borealis]|uniref:Molybdenum carrier n=1 Tax=Paludisphaera borealis TaxID=1387353 RepID=A0A1U7CRQ4_9BACT|nr:putative molybdenum carrier protein [Paludisphaera borealis]APW61627.1 hypothetical protein BSF38_03150 [Paludisphaera borealis]
MKLKILSGGQSGVDQAALRAAKRLGLATGGAMPQGWLTEDGPRPEFAAMYGMVEAPTPGYPARTFRNARDAVMTQWIGPAVSSGHLRDKPYWWQYGRPFYPTSDLSALSAVEQAGIMVEQLACFPSDEIVLTIAGPRESLFPGIGAKARVFLMMFLHEVANSRLFS